MSDKSAGGPPDPITVSTAAELTEALCALRLWAGQPSLARLRQLGGTRTTVNGDIVDQLAESTTSHVLRGERPASAQFVRAFVAACLKARQRGDGESRDDVERWHEAWLRATGEGQLPADVVRGRAAGDGLPPGPATAGPTLATPRPAQLPRDPSAFTGREAEVGQLLSWCDAATGDSSAAMVVCAIDGMAGIGKTTLAVHAAHRMIERFPDGQLFIDLHGFTRTMAPVEPAAALDRLLRMLGVPGDRIPDELDDRAALWRTVLAGRRMLIVLDNAAAEEQVEPLLPGTGGCLVLVTSRHRLARLEATRTMSLGTLPIADAVALFVAAADLRQLTAELRGLVVEAVELCGRLPLAIRITAVRLTGQPTSAVKELVARLRDEDQRLVALADPDGGA